jgi:hypothetical protein
MHWIKVLVPQTDGKRGSGQARPLQASDCRGQSRRSSLLFFIVMRNGLVTATGPRLTSFGSMRMAGSLSTGTCCSACRRHRLMITLCFSITGYATRSTPIMYSRGKESPRSHQPDSYGSVLDRSWSNYRRVLTSQAVALSCSSEIPHWCNPC